MFDTYGEDYFTVRGFVEGGWSTLDVTSGDLSNEGALFQLSTEDFRRDVLPTLTNKDTVIVSFIITSSDQFPAVGHPLVQLAEMSKKKGASTSLILIGETGRKKFAIPECFDLTLTSELPNPYLLPNVPLLHEFAAKLIFNNITTGSCIAKGRVFNNRMINLNVR